MQKYGEYIGNAGREINRLNIEERIKQNQNVIILITVWNIMVEEALHV